MGRDYGVEAAAAKPWFSHGRGNLVGVTTSAWTSRVLSPLDASNSLHPADGLTVWDATRKVDFSCHMY